MREKEFVEAASAAGASDLRIIFRHILPNCVGPIVVTMTLFVALAILTEAALSFLGFGIQPPHPALGSLIADGETNGFDTWWLVTFPGLVIVLVALCVNFIGDGLRDALDPDAATDTDLDVGRVPPLGQGPDRRVRHRGRRRARRHRASATTCSAGETLGVVGESGSGKSVSVMSMLGLIPRAAREGS